MSIYDERIFDLISELEETMTSTGKKYPEGFKDNLKSILSTLDISLERMYKYNDDFKNIPACEEFLNELPL